MNQKIAIEQDLTSIRDLLSNKGYSVDSLDTSNKYSHQMEKYDAIIISGMNKDFLGVQDTNTKAVIIDAKGLTADQVFSELQSRLQ